MNDQAHPLRAAIVTTLTIDGIRLILRVERETGGRTRSTLLDEEGHEIGGELRSRALVRHAAGEGERLHEELEWELWGADGRHRLTLIREAGEGEPRPVRAERLDRPAAPLSARDCRRLAARLAAAQHSQG